MERQLYQQGGGAIYPRMDGLSSGISEAEQQLQQINQSIDQVQSNLGSGGGTPYNPGTQYHPEQGGLLGEGGGMFTGTAPPAQNSDPIMGGFQNSEFRKNANMMQQDAVNFKYGGKDMMMNGSMAGAFEQYLNSIGKGNLMERNNFNAGPLQTQSGGGMLGAYRNMAAGGGIMNAMPRQQYGLGSFVKKAVKGVTGAVKGIASSVKDNPLLAAAALNFAPMLIPGGASTFLGGANAMFNPTLPAFLKGKNTGDGFLKRNAGLIGTSVLGGVLGALSPQEQEEISGNGGRNVEALRSKLTKAYTDLQYDPAKIPDLVANDLSEYTQDMNRTGAMYGGRMGYGDGTPYVEPDPAMMVDTTTFNPIPEDADRQEAAEIVKIMMATRGLPREEGEIEDTETMSTEDFMLNEYFKPKREELMENFGLSLEEANNLIREEAIKIRSNNAYGGRMGYAGGTDFENYLKGREQFEKQQSEEQLYREYIEDMRRQKIAEQRNMAAYGGRIGYAFGTPEQNAIQAAGIEGLPLNQNPAGVTELDLRDSGGFIPPVGVKEKADDIPAMLANNEFVFTADAVRGMGEGNVNKGAQRMYDMMKKLEKGGRV